MNWVGIWFGMGWDELGNGLGHFPIWLGIVFGWDGRNCVGMKWVGLGWDELGWEMDWEMGWEMG